VTLLTWQLWGGHWPVERSRRGEGEEPELSSLELWRISSTLLLLVERHGSHLQSPIKSPTGPTVTAGKLVLTLPGLQCLYPPCIWPPTGYSGLDSICYSGQGRIGGTLSEWRELQNQSEVSATGRL